MRFSRSALCIGGEQQTCALALGLVSFLQHLFYRVCRPEIYRSKLLCHRSLQGMVQELPPLEETEGPGVDQTMVLQWADKVSALREIMGHFIEIIEAEWHPEHGDITHCPEGEDNPTCGFCGADIFLSFFECWDCSFAGQDSDAQPYQICAACYVEGRSCGCRVMKPMQCRDVLALIRDQNSIAKAIDAWAGRLGLSPGTRVPVLSVE